MRFDRIQGQLYEEREKFFNSFNTKQQHTISRLLVSRKIRHMALMFLIIY